uniref:Uncharacterized protein n=1 Tax=Romanomermis culicivorax TaxID=13658 RepID=A0A915IA89_ROMCU
MISPSEGCTFNVKDHGVFLFGVEPTVVRFLQVLAQLNRLNYTTGRKVNHNQCCFVMWEQCMHTSYGA